MLSMDGLRGNYFFRFGGDQSISRASDLRQFTDLIRKTVEEFGESEIATRLFKSDSIPRRKCTLKAPND